MHRRLAEPAGLVRRNSPADGRPWCEAIKAIRNLKAERNVPKEARIAPIIVAQGTVAESLEQGEPFLRRFLPAESVTIVSSTERPAECAVAVLPDAEIILPLEGLIDKEAERAKDAEEPGRLRKADRRLAGQAGERVVRGAGTGRGRHADSRAKLAELESQHADGAALRGDVLNTSAEAARLALTLRANSSMIETCA